ncbi:MAG: divergent polysaccharide deacetylase family protein [Desulfovibrionaceae bacterium]|jgi:polysaccharide deacetylase 2 family uncharacterized protein YibQ|nr:divergent polysaccharide deacetylase family protein [Desulfovibrionaceae bacterium]
MEERTTPDERFTGEPDPDRPDARPESGDTLGGGAEQAKPSRDVAAVASSESGQPDEFGQTDVSGGPAALGEPDAPGAPAWRARLAEALAGRMPVWAVVAVAGAAALTLLVVALLLWPAHRASQAPDVPGAGGPRMADNGTADTGGLGGPDGLGHDGLVYEEALGGPLEESVKRVDYALVQAMAQSGVGPDALEIRDVDVRAVLGQSYHVQTLSIELTGAVDPFARTLAANLDRWATNATLARAEDGSWTVTVFGRRTHRLYLQGHDAVPRPGAAGNARLVVVIDDLGESVTFARRLAALPYPVTFSIWPLATHAREVEDLAVDAGREVLVHQPMEPMGYPRVRPGRGSVFVSMDPAEIRRVVASNLDRLPRAVGLNNHMGSRFTQDRRGVDAVLEELRARHLFILDSLTHPASVVMEEAAREGVPALQRDVFLDVVRDRSAILRQLHKARRLAEHTGAAVAIGHPFPETLQALRDFAAESADVRIVTLARLGGFADPAGSGGAQAAARAPDQAFARPPARGAGQAPAAAAARPAY